MYSTTITGPSLISDVLKYEVNPQYTRDQVTVLGGDGETRRLKLGMVIGAAALAAAVGAAAPGITGGGGISDVAAGPNARIGVYRIVCSDAPSAGGADDAVFAVFDPGDNRLADAVQGVAYDNGQIAFTIGTSGADFVVDDAFTVTLDAGSGKVVQIDFDATDGTQNATGVLLGNVIAPDGEDADGVSLARGPAIIAPSALIWPEGATSGQKAAAIAQLAAKGVITRPAV